MSFPSWDIGKEEFPFRQLPPNTTKYILCGIISSEENTQHLHVSSLKMDNSYSRGWSIISKWRKTFQTLTSCFAWLTGDNLIIKFNTKFYSQNWSYYTWKCAECPEILKKKSFSTKKKNESSMKRSTGVTTLLLLSFWWSFRLFPNFPSCFT